jgi:tetraacyldisaccharide 4'-kinase
MKARLYKYYFDIISGRKKAPILCAFLYILSRIYGLAVALRSKKPSYRPKAYTISVGNIVAGGTGKTPFSIYLAQKYSSVAIVMRPFQDESALFARNLPKAQIFTNTKKVEAAKKADAQGVEVIIIDDGLQHYALARDYNIILLDSENPFGYGQLLPRGLLREPLSALKRADLIVITCRNGHEPSQESLATIKTYTSAPIKRVRITPQGLYDQQNRPQTLPPGTKVGAFCAIAKPEQFTQTLTTLGYQVAFTESLPDHATFTPEFLHQLEQKDKVEVLICTEKDIVKLPPTSLPILYLKIGIEPIDTISFPF